MSDGPSGEAVAPKANGSEPFAFPRSPPTPLAVGKYKPNGWVFGALMGADLFVGAVCHRFVGLHPLLCVAVMAVLPAVVAALVARALLRPKWQRNTKPEHGLVPEIIGQAKRFYGGHIRDPHADFQLAFRDLTVEAKDERDGRPHTLRAWYVPAKPGVGAGGGGSSGERTCVVCVHGAGRDRRAFLRHTPALHAAGLSVVLMDCREHGTSDGRNRGIGYATREARDVAAVSAHVRTALGYARVFVLGTSQGAAAAIVAAALHDRGVAGVIAENPFATRDELMTHIVAAIFGQPPRLLAPLQAAYLRLIVALARLQLGVKNASDGSAAPANPIDVVGALPCGLLLMHGTNDALIPFAHSQRLFEKAPEPKALWLAEQAEHTGLQNAYPDEFERRVLQFIRSTRTPAAAVA